MRNKKRWALACACFLLFSFVACSNDTKQTSQHTITITGSTSVERIVNEMISEYQALHSDINILYTGSGSSAGIKDTLKGINDIGASSRDLSSDETGLVETKFAVDGIAVVVHPSNPVNNLTPKELQDIYTGKITNWKDVGGVDASIYVLSREESSGTRTGFEELVGIDAKEGNPLLRRASVGEGNGPIQLGVASNQYAIGYVSFAYINSTVKGLKINGVEPTVEHVIDGSYLLQRPFLFVTKEGADSSQVNDFLQFALSEDGQHCVELHEGIPIH